MGGARSPGGSPPLPLRSREAFEAYRAAVTGRPRPRVVLRVCGDTGCLAAGAEAVLEALRREAAALAGDGIEVRRVGCPGFCSRGPVVIIDREGEPPVFCQGVEPVHADALVGQALTPGGVVPDLVFSDEEGRALPRLDEVPFFTRQTRVALRDCGLIDPTDIDAFIARDGYLALVKALFEMSPDDVLDAVERSGLRGRGGGGFPTGAKWRLMAAQPQRPKYVVCNADEGDPGAFMDRGILEGDPHAVIEGMLIGAYAMGASEGVVYCRAEYPLAIARLRTAIGQATALGLLGDDVLGTGFSFGLRVKEGAGAFVCGEETALIASVEGRRGMPRPRPPYPAVSGLRGKPTTINNVETWANVAPIVLRGPEWFRTLGTPGSPGTKVFSLAGKLRNTGLVEVPMGVTLRDLVFGVGGGMTAGRRFKAVQMGGPSGGCLGPAHLDLPVDYDSLKGAGAIMGSGGVIVLDETACMVDLARFFLRFTQSESCGKCVPCRLGTKRMLEILERITAGEAEPDDLDRLERLARTVARTSLCGLGQTAPNPVLSTLRHFRREYEEHVFDRRCRAGACRALAKAPCTNACPAGVDTPSYVALVAAGRPDEALAVHLERNPFPSVCGRVCHHPCEVMCRRGDLDAPVAIAAVKRFMADVTAARRASAPARVTRPQQVAVVGGGPAGLTCAYHLALAGFPVTVFEAEAALGGMLRYGIPPFRLPRDVLEREIEAVVDLGLTVRTGLRLGRDFTLDGLFGEGFAAVFVAVGAERAAPLGVENDAAPGVMPALDLLRAANRGESVAVGRRVVVVGGGSVAMDAARTALRLQAAAGKAGDVTVVYRRSRAEMPAHEWEVREAEEEGVRLVFLTAPTRVLLGEGGRVRGLECLRVELGEVQPDGRRRPRPLPGSEHVVECDTVVAATGLAVDTRLFDGVLDLDPDGTVVVDQRTGATSRRGVFAGGDAVRGPATVVEAIGDGQRAAFAIEEYLTGRAGRAAELAARQRLRRVPRAEAVGAGAARAVPSCLDPRQRLAGFAEVVAGLDEGAARAEAARCLRCDLDG